MKRASGVLMHVSSLYGSDSIGCFGKEAKEFIDYLEKGGFSYWQVLPFCIADDCNSPYKSFSAFGGNPYFVDIRTLAERGYLTHGEVNAVGEETPYACEYHWLSKTRMDLLRLAASRVPTAARSVVTDYIEANPHIAKCCEFMALRTANEDKPWTEWTVNTPDPDELFAWQFIQYEFHRQWAEIRAYANEKGIRIIGDIPIYVAYDSCDVWANRDQFDLDENKAPCHVAGCPPDYFAEDGQLWGNPLYKWDRMKEDGYTWWSDRMRHMLTLFDGVRIDHFRGLESYWSIPAEAKTAKEGKWEEGPGMPFITQMKKVAAEFEQKTGEKPLIIAEDLGDITDEVKRFVEDSGFPGMRVLQFAFMGDPDTPHLPHHYIPNCVAYTGTHDNNTLLGYVWEMDEENRRHALQYCGFVEKDWNCHGTYDAMIRTMMVSVADLVILPIQDVCHFGADTRMNVPGKAQGNWAYRITKSQLDAVDWTTYRKWNTMYGRRKA